MGNDIKLVKELAKAGEFYSKHPIGMAIYENISFPMEEKDIKNYRNITGYGVSLEYKGKNIFLGKETYLMEQNIAHPEVKVLL